MNNYVDDEFEKDLAESLKDPAVKRAYDALEVEDQIARKLTEMRIKEKLTQQQLADRIGVTQNTITRAESGHSNPRMSTLVKVASGLGMKLTLVKAD